MDTGGGWSHCVCSQEAKREQEMELSYDALRPSLSDTFPPASLPNLLSSTQLGDPGLKCVSLSLAILNLPNSETLECSPSCCGDHSYKVIPWPPHNYNFAAVMNQDVNICGFGWY